MGNLDSLFAENESLRGSCKAMGADMGKLTRERNSFRAKAEKLKSENEALRNPMRLEYGQGALDYVDGWNACADHIKKGGSHE